jgi:segregation and condensation protein A
MPNEPEQMTSAMDYEVKLEIFQGPLDLLLHLIRKNEVDIFDIPIATIADQYLVYLDMMKALNINVVGDFLVMASTLLHIKSKMLLPDLEEEEEEDPRVEITRPLLEYLRLKEMAGELLDRELLDRDVFVRQLSPDYTVQMEGEEPLLDVNLFQLMDAFKKILDERLPGVDRTISEFIVTFLAMLELINVGMIRVFQPNADKDIQLKAYFKDNGGEYP